MSLSKTSVHKCGLRSCAVLASRQDALDFHNLYLTGAGAFVNYQLPNCQALIRGWSALEIIIP